MSEKETIIREKENRLIKTRNPVLFKLDFCNHCPFIASLSVYVRRKTIEKINTGNLKEMLAARKLRK